MSAGKGTAVEATIAASRFGLGARPGELALLSRDPRAALRAQLENGAPLLDDAGLVPSQQILKQAAAQRTTRRDDAAAAKAALQKLPQLYRPIYVNEATARFRQAVATERPFPERLVHFWSNHFAVSIDKLAVLGLAGSYEREAIRPHVLGRFEDLLLAVERHPAMLLYLDNVRSIGPNSRAAAFAARRHAQRTPGLNENLAREVLELHTLGVDGGYTQRDVTTFAQVLTGWSLGGGRGRRAHGEPGAFAFRPELHEPGTKTVLGTHYAQEGERQGVAVLRDLARHPATARHIATKLARHFVADDPPTTVVDRLTKAWQRSDGDLPAIYRALIDSPEVWASPLAKFRTPADYAHAAHRALELPVGDGTRALAPLELLGQRIFSPGSPAGWPDRSADWDGSSAVMKRVEWADAVGRRLGDRRNVATLAPDVLGAILSKATATAIARAASGAQALTLFLASPEFMRR